jgi:hypothetical protein
MKATYLGKNAKLIDAIDYIEDLFQDQEFWDAISNHDRFDYTEYAPSKIGGYMQNEEKVVEVRLYRPPFWKHRRTNAYTDKRYPNTLFYNSKKLWRDVGKIVNTVVHECVHAVDFTDDEHANIDYGHGSQANEGKENSAPYWIGSLAEHFYQEDSNASPQIEMTEIDPNDIVNE